MSLQVPSSFKLWTISCNAPLEHPTGGAPLHLHGVAEKATRLLKGCLNYCSHVSNDMCMVRFLMRFRITSEEKIVPTHPPLARPKGEWGYTFQREKERYVHEEHERLKPHIMMSLQVPSFPSLCTINCNAPLEHPTGGAQANNLSIYVIMHHIAGVTSKMTL